MSKLLIDKTKIE